MSKTFRAIYQDGVFHPLEQIDLKDSSEVLVTVEATEQESNEATTDDPLAGISFASGLGDLSKRFDDYRFGQKQ